MHNQNNGFALVLVHSYTIICPTTMQKEISKCYLAFFLPRNKRILTNRGNSDHHGVIRPTMYIVNGVPYGSTRQKIKEYENGVLRTFWEKIMRGKTTTV